MATAIYDRHHASLMDRSDGPRSVEIVIDKTIEYSLEDLEENSTMQVGRVAVLAPASGGGCLMPSTR
jgi:hypothetical protein